MILSEEYEACKKRGLRVESEEGGYYFVSNSKGVVYPVRDTTVSMWVKEDKIEEEEK